MAGEPTRARSVLFVCSANQCRSPMAETLFRELVQKQNPSNFEWRIASAGCWASTGQPATATAVEAMRLRGLDLSEHRSQPVTEALLAAFDLILCMQYDHKATLRRNYPQAAERVFLLSEMSGEEQEIWDPVGYPLDLYQAAADEIMDYLSSGYEKILRLTDPD